MLMRAAFSVGGHILGAFGTSLDGMVWMWGSRHPEIMYSKAPESAVVQTLNTSVFTVPTYPSEELNLRPCHC